MMFAEILDTVKQVTWLKPDTNHKRMRARMNIHSLFFAPLLKNTTTSMTQI
jgi:hypothetical protein